MSELTVVRWRKYGKDRLYVCADGLQLGWHDVPSGESYVPDRVRAPAFHAAVARWRAARPASVARSLSRLAGRRPPPRHRRAAPTA